MTEYYYPHLGGVCEHVHFFAREARRLGHHVDIVTSHIGGAEPMPGVIRLGRSQSVYCNGSQARITLGRDLRGRVRAVLRQGRYDVVHVHCPLTPVLPLLAIEEADCAVVGTFHTYFHRSLAYRVWRRYFQRRLDMLSAAIAVSRSTTRALDRYFGADWLVVPNGIDTELFHPAAAPPAGWRDDLPTILFLGRFDPRNGLAALIDAFRRVRGARRRARLVVVGDGPLRDLYRRLAGQDPDITFAGALRDGRPGYYANSAVYACPTTIASFGITLLESMACATPVVCSDISGFRDVVRHGREALTTRREDTGALADALVRLLDDPSLRTRLGSAGRAEALAYRWEDVTRTVLGIYDRVLGRVPAAGPAGSVAR